MDENEYILIALNLGVTKNACKMLIYQQNSKISNFTES